MADREEIKKDIVRKLLVRSGNQCAMPGCTNPIYTANNNYVAEIAHIYPVGDKGPRHDAAIAESYINTYLNLLLLCPGCHTEIDKDPAKYPAKYLQDIKKKHEETYAAIPVSKQLERIADIALERFHAGLLAIKDEIISRMDERFDRLTEQMEAGFLRIASPAQNLFDFSEHVSQVKGLRAEGMHHAVIKLLNDFKTSHWIKLSDEDKYKWQVNLALTYLDLSDYATASPLLINLKDFNYKNEALYGLISIGYLIKEQFDKAEHYARLSISEFPQEPNAYISLLKIQSLGKLSNNVIPEIPDSLVNNLVIKIARAKIFEDRDDPTKACEIYATLDLEQIEEPFSKYDAMSYYGIALMQTIRHPELIMEGARNELELAIIDKALSLFSESIEYFKNTNLYGSRYYCHINRGVIHKIMGRRREADLDFYQAFTLRKGFITFRYLLLNRPTEEWEALFKEAEALDPAPNEQIELTELEAEYYFNQGNIDRATTKLQNIRATVDRNAAQNLYYYLILADSYILLNQKENYDALLAFIASFPALEFAYYYLSLRKSVLEKDQNLYSKFAPLLAEKANELDHSWIRTMVMRVYISIKDYWNAQYVIRPLCTKAQFSNHSRNLMQCLFLGGFYREAADWIKSYISIDQADDFIIDILSSIYDACSRREEAILAIEAYLSKRPSLFLQVKLALFYCGLNKLDKCKEELAKIGDIEPLNVYNKFQVATAYVMTDESGKGLELAYEIRCEYKSHSLYAQFITLRCLNLEGYTAPSKITANTYVLLKTPDSSVEYILCTFPKYEREEPLSSAVASQLLGSKLGEPVSINKKEYVIDKIQSKYAHALNESLAFLKATPDQSGMIEIFDHSEKSEANVTDEFQKSVLQQQLNESNFIISQDEQRRFFESVAQNLGDNAIKFWLKQLGHSNITLMATLSLQQLLEFRDKINNEDEFIYDIFSLLTVHLTESWHLIEKDKHKKFVTRSVLRVIENEINLANRGAVYVDEMIIVPTKSGAYQHTYTAEDQKKYRDSIIRFKEQITQLFSIVDIEISENAGLKAAFDNQFGRCNSDIITTLLARNLILISEDVYFRSTMAVQLPAKPLAGSSAMFAFYLLNSQKISQFEYNDFLFKLLKINYANIPIDLNLLLHIFGLAENVRGENVTSVIKIYLGNKPVQDRVLVVLNFLTELFKLKIKNKEKLSQAAQMIAIYSAAENSFNTRNLLSNKIELDTSLSPIVKKNLLRIISTIPHVTA